MTFFSSAVIGAVCADEPDRAAVLLAMLSPLDSEKRRHGILNGCGLGRSLNWRPYVTLTARLRNTYGDLD